MDIEFNKAEKTNFISVMFKQLKSVFVGLMFRYEIDLY